MADEDRTRAGANAGSELSDRRGAHRPPGITSGQTRSALRRLARGRQRRRWAVEGLAVLACLVALVSYLGNRPAPEGGDNSAGPPGAQAGTARPTGFPAAEGRTGEAGPASPGLRPRQRPPSPTPTPSASSPAPLPAPPVLLVTRADVAAEVDLTAVGTRDWMHWGLRGGDSTVRKRDGAGEILDEGGAGTRVGWDGNQEVFSWRDGTPERSVTDTPNGIYTCGTGSGFALAVAGSGELRTVHLYAGIWMARGRLEARLASGGLSTTLRMEDPYTSQSAQFTVRFRAPKGARLVLTWTVEKVFTEHCGNVGLQALALR
ncbi:hypothetical protein ACFOW4_13150 [Micromonospora sp. GCM10011542]|uniref:hypothetical protein n=1 Tax=Micromonospora sp. GCM10011542 TaxID=3317337 RepID=UPI0036126676